MKKHFILLGLALLALASCKKDTEVRQVNQAFGTVFEIQPDNWITPDDGFSYYTSLDDLPELTDNIFDHGAVLTYLSFSDSVYEALPEVFDGISYGAVHVLGGGVQVDMHAIDGSQIAPPSGVVLAKVVLIDAQALKLHPDVNLRDFNAVKRTFHVK